MPIWFYILSITLWILVFFALVGMIFIDDALSLIDTKGVDWWKNNGQKLYRKFPFGVILVCIKYRKIIYRR